jgi:alpha-2-macroglobulin
MTSTSLGTLAQGFGQLVDYPYGCLEQQSSRLVPFVALREIAGQFGMPWPERSDSQAAAQNEQAQWMRAYLGSTLDLSQARGPNEVIDSTVKSISALQDTSGGFRYWDSADFVSPWASAYATLALSRARDVGFSVSAERLNRAAAYLAKVAGGSCPGVRDSECPDETRVFAAYVLARMQKPKASNYSELYERRAKLPLFAQALLANAMFVGGGDRNKANALLKEILNSAKESAKGVSFAESNSRTGATLFHSDTRTTAVVLQALTDISPQHPYVAKMTRYLTGVRQGSGEWRNTQEAAFSLMALTQVLRTKEKDAPDFQASVVLGANQLVNQAFKGRSTEMKSSSVPMRTLLEGKEQKLSFKKDGTGVLYYSAVMRYAQKSPPTTSLDNGLFVQRWFEPFNGGGQAKKFYAGDLVRVRLRVATNQERHWTAFEVPVPAGLEPVDTSLSTTAGLARGPREQSRGVSADVEEGEGGEEDDGEVGDGSDYAYRFYSPFTHTEMRDSKVVFFADHLNPGIHTVSFVARATTPGSFVLKPARGTLMYEPEVFGRSEGGTFEVILPPQVSQK